MSAGATGELELERVAALARAALGEPIASAEPIGAGIGLRRFYRVTSAHGRSAIARVEGEEDPAGRPPGIAPEPPLEPIRALLERAGLPVPKRLGAARDIVALNAGASIYVAGLAQTLGEGVKKELAVLESGAARKKLDQFVAFTRKHV